MFFAAGAFTIRTMARRDRKISPQMQRFQMVAFAVVLAGLPLAFAVPGTMMGKLYAFIAVPIVAFGAAGALAYLGRGKARAGQEAAASPLEAALPVWRPVDAPANTLDTSQWSLELVRRLEWRRFQELCSAYFECVGFRVMWTPPGVEGGPDMKLYEKGSQAASIAVRCKAWNVYTIGIGAIRELIAVLATEKIGEGLFATSATFTPEAQALARKHNIRLLDGTDLLGKLAELPADKNAALLALATQGDYATPTCPACLVKMGPRTSEKDGRRLWGCPNHPACDKTFLGAVNTPA